ncbi:uncharacterized protein H6S33_008958 [Morchella sextelata]|uniref:uncharacterized protein n=1 Tax=Morchella sextelata TaxID=1174677 RepID=UPI001D03958C|nr:uncharacterized protein H6S33_008958 [Morchella sextelata]KAH0612578.1 hypothetical protein H6S33_008958 [Morchella sextelata]
MSVRDTQAENLLALLKGSDVDQKIAEFANIKSQVKHQHVQTEAIGPLFEACRLGVSSPNNTLSLHALSCLGHLIKRVTLQDVARIRPHVAHILPVLIEKLGDQKDRSRSVALTGLLDLWKSSGPDVERGIKELGFGSKIPRCRQESLNWLLQVHHSQQGFSFRSFTPFMIKMLEDASEPVRESAKDVVVELFKNAPDHAKSDLKRELQNRQVRKAIATYIVSQLGIPGGEAEMRNTVRSPEGHEEEVESAKGGKSVAGSMASSVYVQSMPGSEMESGIEPLYVNTNRELEEIMHGMADAFEGRESEGNWAARDKNVTKLRQLVRGNAYKDYQTTFLVSLKSLLDGILKTVNSLRTTVATNGGQLLKDLAKIIGPGLDPMMEILMMNLIKLCAGTKKITSQLGNVTTAVLISNISYHVKLVQQLLIACNDKNVQPRSYAAGWLRILLETHIDQKGYIEHSGGTDVIEKCIKRGLSDANPGVREGMRSTYWLFASIWAARAEALMDTLDASSQKLLQKGNPNPGATAAPKGVSNLRQPLGRGPAPGRPSVKEAILASKKSRGELRPQTGPTDMGPPAATQSGLASAPLRPQRPHVKTRAAVPERTHADAPSVKRELSPSGAYQSGQRTSPLQNSRTNGVRSPPLSPPTRNFHDRAVRMHSTPQRQQSPLIGSSGRKLTVLEQLNHNDWRVRVEGVVIVACLLAKKTPPNYDGQKMPTLPPSDVFAPTLAKLLNDPQPEVVEHVVAPEVLAELVKVVPMDQIVPKVLLLSESDDAEHSQPIMSHSMPALKKLMTESEAAEMLFKIITSMGVSGVVPRKLAVGSFTTTQKRKILHGCLIWMCEIVESHLKGAQNEFLSDSSNFKLWTNRLIAMLNNTRVPNYGPLTTLLKNLQKMDPEAFDKILMTFESQTVRDLKKAWGVNVEDETEAIIIEEKVADVEQVLGSVPKIGKTPMNPQQINASSMARKESSIGDDVSFSKDEDITMISLPPLPPALKAATPTRVRENEKKLQDLPPLPTTPIDNTPDLLGLSMRKSGRADDKNPTIKVYQDPIVESNGAVATGGDKQQGPGYGEWNRTKMKKQISNSNLPKTPEHSSRLLITLITRLQNREIDTQAFRKLIGIARENPVRAVLQENNGEHLYDIWENGKMFDELLIALLEYLDDESIDVDRAADLRVQGLLVLKQLLSKTAPYFSRHEPAVLRTLIDLRGKYPTQSHVTTGIEEISEEFLALVDPYTGIEAILNMMLPKDAPGFRPPTQSWCMALTCLAALVRSSKASTLDPQMPRLGVLAVKSLDDEDAEVRRSCVSMCIEMHSKLGNDERLFDEIFKGLKSGHQNLLTYYFAKREGEMRQ